MLGLKALEEAGCQMGEASADWHVSVQLLWVSLAASALHVDKEAEQSSGADD
jgi:hypothetical protein